MKAGYDLWAKQQNDAGGIKAGSDTYKVEISYTDYQSNTPRAVQSAELMITEGKVDAIFAPFGSGATKAVSAITEKYGVPMIAAQAASAQVYDQGFKYLFGMYTPNDTVTRPLIDLLIAKNPSIKRVAVLARNDLFPLAIADELTKYAKEKGFEIVSEQKFPIGTVDFSSALTQIRSSNPDLIYATGYVNDMMLIRKQMEELGVRAQLTAMLVGPTTPEFIATTGKLAENVVTASWWDVAAKFKGDDVFGSAENFEQLFRKTYNNTYPDYSVAASAACGVVLATRRQQGGNGRQGQGARPARGDGRQHLLRPDQVRTDRPDQFAEAADHADPERQARRGRSARDRAGADPLRQEIAATASTALPNARREPAMRPAPPTATDTGKTGG